MSNIMLNDYESSKNKSNYFKLKKYLNDKKYNYSFIKDIHLGFDLTSNKHVYKLKLFGIKICYKSIIWNKNKIKVNYFLYNKTMKLITEPVITSINITLKKGIKEFGSKWSIPINYNIK